MKQHHILTLFFITAITCLSSNAQGTKGDTWQSVKQNGSGTLHLVYSEFPTFSFKTPSGTYSGINVEVMNDFVAYVKETHNVTLKVNYIDMTEGIGDYMHIKSSSGGVICIVDFVRTPGRETEVSFSNNFDQTYELLITAGNVASLSDIKKIGSEFVDFTGYAVEGTVNEKRLKDIKLKYFPKLTIQTVKDYKTLQTLFIKNPKGFAYMDVYSYIELVRKKASLKHHEAATVATDVTAFIMPKGSDWLPIFNSFLSAKNGYRNSTQYKKHLMNYIGESGLKILNIVSK